MTNKIKSFAICLLVAIAMVMGAFALNTVGASGSFKMQNGASIRIRNTDNTYGIQFFANVDTSVEDATYNLMILPQTYVDFYEADNTQNKAPLAEWMLAKKAAHPEMPLAIVKNLIPDEDGVIKGSIVNVLYQNLNTKFVGAAYYEVEGEPVCADLATDDGRTVVEVAELAIADPENADFVTDLQGIVKDGIHQANGKEQESVEPITVAMNKTTANMYIGQELTLSYTPTIATSLAKWSVEGDAVTVENGKVTAVKAGTATVSVEVMGATASCAVTVSNVQVINAENVTVNAESATKGSVTFTSPEGAYVTSGGSITSLVEIKGDFDDEFIKVDFRTPKDLSKPAHVDAKDWSNYLGNALGVGARATESSIANYAVNYNSLSLHLNVIPSAFGGGISINSNGANSYPYWYSSLIVNNKGYAIAADTEYSFVYGITSNETRGNVIYFAILDANDDLMWSGAYAQSNLTEVSHKKEIAESGSFYISSGLSKQERTVSYEVISVADAMEIITDGKVSAPTVAVTDSTITITKADYADAFKYKCGTNDWTISTSDVITLENITLANVEVVAYNDYFESSIANCTVANLEDDIALVGLSKVSSPELTHERGSITFESNGKYNAGGVLMLKKNYTNELIKVGFTAPSAAIYSHTPAIEIGMREGTETTKNIGTTTVNSVASQAYRFWNYGSNTNTTYNYVSLGKYDANWHSDNSLSTIVFGTGATMPKPTENRYYMVAGMVTSEDGQIDAYYGLLDADNKPIKIVKFDISAIVKSGKSAPADSGWFNIYIYHASGTIDYEIIELSDLLSVSGATNAASATISKSGNVTTFKLKPNTLSNSNYNQPGNVMAFGSLESYDTEFIKLGFYADHAQLTQNCINIGLRANRISGLAYNVMPYWNIRLFQWSGSNHQVSLTWGADNNYIALADTCSALNTGDLYYLIAGVVDGAEGAKTVYWACTDADGNILKKVSWNYPPSNGTGTMADSGCFAISSWYRANQTPTERTFTYEILSQADGLAACGVTA